MNTTVLYFVILNVSAGLFKGNCTSLSIAYTNRLGSLLATDLSLWLLSSLTGRYFCYSGKALMPSDEPEKLSIKIVSKLMSQLPKVKNIEELRTQGEWYYTMISGTPLGPKAKGYLDCLLKYDDLRALYCFLALKGYYESFYRGMRAVVLNPCLPNVTDPGEVWASAVLSQRIRGGNLTLTINLLYSYYAYALYYKKRDLPFIKYLIGAVTNEACSPLEAALAMLCRLAKGHDWGACFTLLSFTLSGR